MKANTTRKKQPYTQQHHRIMNIAIPFNNLIPYDPSNHFFERCQHQQHPVVFHTYTGTMQGQVQQLDKDQLRIGKNTVLSKHEILFCYKQCDSPTVCAVLQVDDGVVAKGFHDPELDASQRVLIPVNFQKQAVKQGWALCVTLRDGTQIIGTLLRYGDLSFLLEVADKVHVYVLKHNIYDFERPMPLLQQLAV